MSELLTLEEAQQAREIAMLKRRIFELEAIAERRLPPLVGGPFDPNGIETVPLRSKDIVTLHRVITVESSYDVYRGGFRVRGVCGHPEGDFQVSYFCSEVRMEPRVMASLLVKQHEHFVNVTLDTLERRR